MAESYLNLSEEDQKEILSSSAASLGRQASVLEKDIWVCWALQTLFSIPEAHPMAFKGGTSLSKVYGAIDRFSEDVDVTLDYRHFEDEFDPHAKGVSKNQVRKYGERLKGYVKDFAHATIVPALRAGLDELPSASQHEIKLDDEGEKIWVTFPSVVEGVDDYLKSNILIELGGRNVIDPNEVHTISPYVQEVTTGVDYPAAEVVVLSPERTFWEKATLIHVECNRGTMKGSAERLSRHWYDLVKLGQHASGQSAVNNRDLFEDVIRHKKIFFNAGYANYDCCLKGELKLIPDRDMLKSLATDYDKMVSAGMMYESPPSFDEVIEGLEQLEGEINIWEGGK